MSSTTSNWRQRRAEKERIQKEQIELARQKTFANTEENFPSTISATARKIVSDGGPDLAARILEAHIKEEVRKQVAAYHKAENERQRQDIVNGVYIFRHRRGGEDVEEEDYEEEDYEEPLSLDEKFPGHGRRGTFTPPDDEGWRLVIKRVRRKKEMTNAELERKAALSQDEDSEDGENNVDLNDRNQRRDFY